MIVVLEGLPASGKTTIANYLQVNCNFNKVNESLGYLGGVNLSDDQGEIFQETLKKYNLAKISKSHSVIDRGYASMLAWDYCAAHLKIADNLSTKNKWVTKAIKKGLLYEPDIYIYLAISEETSLTRRPRRENIKDVWTSVLGLKYCLDYYAYFFGKEENKKKTIFIDAEMNTKEVIKILKAKLLI
jgi:thymidylate kinase